MKKPYCRGPISLRTAFLSLVLLLFLFPFFGNLKANAFSVDADGVYYISDAEGLSRFSEQGGLFTVSRAVLTADIYYSGEGLVLEDGRYALDLNGHTVECSSESPLFSLLPDATLTVTDSVGGEGIKSAGAVFNNGGNLNLDGISIFYSNSYAGTETSTLVNRNTAHITDCTINSMSNLSSYAVFNTGELILELSELSSSTVTLGSFGIPESVSIQNCALRSNDGSITVSDSEIGGIRIDKADGSPVTPREFIKAGQAIYDVANYSWYSDSDLLVDGMIKGAFKVMTAPLRLVAKAPDVTYEAALLPDEIILSVTAAANEPIEYLWLHDNSVESTASVNPDTLSLGENIVRCKISRGNFEIFTDFRITLVKSDITLAALTTDGESLYTRAEHKPIKGLYYGGRPLTEGVDYSATYLRAGEETSDLTSVGEITVKIRGIGCFYGETELTYSVLPIPLAVTVGDKWAHSNSLPSLSVSEGLLEGDSVFATFLEDGHTVSASSVKITDAGGADVTSSYSVTLQSGRRHIPSDTLGYSADAHFTVCTYGCDGVTLRSTPHTLSSDGFCAQCGYAQALSESRAEKAVWVIILVSITGAFLSVIAATVLFKKYYKRKNNKTS